MSIYRIGSFNCKNFIYENDINKFMLIKEIISKTNVDMLLLQEFSAKHKTNMELPNGWDIELYHGKWFTNKFEGFFDKIKNTDLDPEDDTNKEYMRNPNNDNGYAILWRKDKFVLNKFENNRSIKNLLIKRNSSNKLARPPQIEYFTTKNNNKNILAVMNTHLTFNGDFDLIYPRAAFYNLVTNGILSGVRRDPDLPTQHDFEKASEKIQARVKEMSELLQLYDSVNNQGSLGVHYTTILGGDFNLSLDYLKILKNAPEGFPSNTKDYNNLKRNDATEQYNKIYAENSNKTTLHKVYKEDSLYDYKYHSYDHFIINQEGCKTEVFDSVKCLKSFFDESKGDKSPRNDEHYNKLSDHLPVVITVNL